MQAELQLSPDQEQRLLSTREAILGQVQAISAERQRISAALQVHPGQICHPDPHAFSRTRAACALHLNIVRSSDW